MNKIIFFFFYVGEGSALFVVLIENSMRSLWDFSQTSMMRGCLGKKLALIPGTKLVITIDVPDLIGGKESISSETLEVPLSGRRDVTVMLELLNKRLETLDLISIMLELERICIPNKLYFSFDRYEREYQIRENLSCVPKLQKMEQLP